MDALGCFAEQKTLEAVDAMTMIGNELLELASIPRTTDVLTTVFIKP